MSWRLLFKRLWFPGLIETIGWVLIIWHLVAQGSPTVAGVSVLVIGVTFVLVAVVAYLLVLTTGPGGDDDS